MSTGDLLNVHPSDQLEFLFELKKQISCSCQLTNKTDQYIAFKVKTTNPKKYCVRPNHGIVLPRSVCNVTITMQAQKEAPPNMKCKDKFLVQAVVAPRGATTKDVTADMFNKEGKKVVQEYKLRAVYIPATPSLVPGEFEEGSSPTAEHGSQSSTRPDVLIQPARLGGASTGDFLSLYPSGLKFPFELKKQISCSFQLTNKTDQYIAFKVKTTDPKKYCVRPNKGIVLPRYVCDVTVIMQAQKEVPPNMECKDKFLVQAIVAPYGASVKDITADMFNKEDKSVVEECKLRVVYILGNPPPPVPEEYEECFSTMAEHGSQSSSRPDVFNIEDKKVVEECKLRVEHESNEGSSTMSPEHEFHRSSRPNVETKSREHKEEIHSKEVRQLWSLVSYVTDEKVAAPKRSQKLQQELIYPNAILRNETVKVRSGGYPVLFVVMIGIISFVVGYLIKQQQQLER